MVYEAADEGQQVSIMSQAMKDTIIKLEEIITEIQDSLDSTETINYLLDHTTEKIQKSLHQVIMQPLSNLLSLFPQTLQNVYPLFCIAFFIRLFKQFAFFSKF